MSYRVDTDIPYGNACDIHVVSGGDGVDVRFTPDPHGGPETIWFCFRVERKDSTAPTDRFRLVLAHSENMLGGGRPQSLLPVVRRPDSDWERIGPGILEPLPDGRLDVAYELAAPDPWLEAAVCYPYGDEDVDALAADTGWRLDTIGVSQQARPIRRLSNGPGTSGDSRPGLYLIARQHSGETPGSWVLDGVIRRLAEEGDAAPLVWAVPLSNPDGVACGDYGKDNFPYDLNRAWGQPPMRHETLVIQRDCARWQGRCKPALGLDFHAPGATEWEGCYFFLPTPELFPTYHEDGKQWVDRLAGAIGDGYLREDPARVAAYKSRWDTPSFTQDRCSRLEVCGLTMEVPYGSAYDIVLTREEDGSIGRRLAEGLLGAL